MTRPPHMELADYVRELTEHHTHAEHYQIRRGTTWYGANHVTKAPPLIVQLFTSDVASAAAEEGPRAGFQSKPAARLDAIDTAIRIDLAAARWVRDLGEDDPGDTIDPKTERVIPGSGTIACVHRLHGLAASADQVTRRAIEGDVRRWWTQARIVTGWDSPAWSPSNTCPQCGERGTLKVRLAEHIGMCTHDACRATWDESTIGLLADHIRAESSAERRVPEGRGPCWCPWPEPTVRDLSRLCPSCGSARCRHAVQARLVDLVRGNERMGA